MDVNMRNERPRWVKLLPWMVLLAILVVAALPTLLYPLTRDQGAYAFIADLMMQGGVPYRDAWDLKPPAVYFVYWLAFSLFGRSEFAVRLFDVLYTLLSAASVYVLAREAFRDRRIATLSAWLYAFCYYLLVHFYSAANPESFMVPLLVLSVYGLVRALPDQSGLPLLLSGVASGLAFWFKPTAGVVVLPVLTWAGIEIWQQHRTMEKVVRSLAAVLVGGLLGLLPVGLYLYGHGLAELLELWRVYGTGAYLGARGLALGDGPLAMLDVIVRYLRDWQLLVWLSLAGALGVLARRQDNRPAGAVAVFLLSSVAATLLQGKLFEYHWIPAFAPAAILSAACLIGLLREARGQVGSSLRAALSTWRDMRTAFAVVVIIGLLILTGYDNLARYRRMAVYLAGRMSAEQYYAQFDIGTDFSRTGTLRAATYLREHTEPGETAFIWGAEPLVNFLAQRPSPTKYIFTYMLVSEGGSSRLDASRRNLINDLDKAKPTYVVLVEGDVTPLTPLGSRAQLDEFPALKAILESEYRFEIQVEDYLFYRKLGNEASFKAGMKKVSPVRYHYISCFHTSRV
jgi:4-amino-4-deoxy-L-arabinose transferase-like glycosyltransferase